MTHILQRRDTAANWTLYNPVLFTGEIGWELDTRKAKLGDGVTAWSDLDYIIEGEVLSVAGLQGAITLADLSLDQVDNTSDVNKPVSTAQQTAHDSLQGSIDTLQTDKADRTELDAYALDTDLDLYALKSDVPSIEEIAVVVSLHWPNQPEPMTRSATDTNLRDTPLMSLPFDWYLLSVELVFSGTVSSSDTNYWFLQLQQFENGGSNAVIAEKTTETTGGEGVLADFPWRFDSGTFDAAGRLFGPNKVLRLRASPTGSPGDLSGPAIAVIRYARQ